MADINNLAQAILNAVNAANIAPPQQPGPFALVPGMNNQQPLDFNKGEDTKFFNKAITAAEDKFDLKEDNLRSFLDVVQERARIYNWADVINIPDINGVDRNLITNYGQLTVVDCTTYAETVIIQPNRRAQNDMMLFQFVSNSLTADARLKLVSNPALYTINGTPSGLLFMKILIGKSSIDTKAKTLLLRNEISSLPSKMVELKGNVREFNVYVEHKRQQLLGRGQSVDELMAHLFNAYLRVPDQDFIRYIQTKKDGFEEEDDMEVDELMNLALVRYDLLSQQNAVNQEGDERVVALLAKQEERERSSHHHNNKSINEEKLTALIAKLQGMHNKFAKGGQGNNKQNNDQKNAWKKVKPSPNESLTKTVNGRPYNWCKFHEAWTMHKQAECTLGNNSHGNNTHTENKFKQEDPQEMMKLNQALLAMMNLDASE